MKWALGLLAALAICGGAKAADLCTAIALRDVTSVENPEAVLKKGNLDRAVSQYRIDRKTGLPSICSHGGSCYPTVVVENGAKVEVLQLTNCKVGKQEADETDDDYFYYDVTMDTSRNSAATLRFDDLDNRLLDIGLCSACANNAAAIYIKHPSSKCGKMVKRALAGSADAKAALDANPDYCIDK